MTKRYYHKKLIRDKVPQKIERNHGTYETRILGTREFEKELKKKLLEEAKEIITAPKGGMINELADILELIKSVATHYKIPFKKVERFQQEKQNKLGAFKKRIFLIWSDQAAGK